MSAGNESRRSASGARATSWLRPRTPEGRTALKDDEPPEDEDEPFDDAVVEIPITGEIDLHAFAPADVVAVVEDYLAACRARGILEVRLVHGRGKGVQRAALRRLLASIAWVEWFGDAPPSSGGWGATLARLRSGAATG